MSKDEPKFWLVMSLVESVSIKSVMSPTESSATPLRWADGMVGCLPVFETKEQAEKYADGRHEVVAIKAKENQKSPSNTKNPTGGRLINESGFY